MVLLKMLMEIALPKMGELLVMMMTMISPSGREVPTAESLRQRAKVLVPKFRRWAEEGSTHQGTPGPPGAPRWVVPTWWPSSGTYLLQYLLNIP